MLAKFALRSIFLLLAVFALHARAAEFVTGTEDLPLMPGLVALDGAVVFDKPEGRIVEAEARGQLARANVRAFYDTTLPQLGWNALAANAWRRENEMLRIDVRGSDGDLTVSFTIEPQQEPHQ